MQENVPYEYEYVHSVRIEPTKLILVGSRITAPSDRGRLSNLDHMGFWHHSPFDAVLFIRSASVRASRTE